MKATCVLIFVMVAVAASAQEPIPGALCDGVVPAAVHDFWEKWNAADLVVYAVPTVAIGSRMGWIVVSDTLPDAVTEDFLVTTVQVWKGPTTLPPMNVTTSWGYQLWYCEPLRSCYFDPEMCSVYFSDGTPQVMFLRHLDERWCTYRAFGTGTYDLSWLETQVVTPVASTAESWGAVKARFR
jgi:hypothetical protein